MKEIVITVLAAVGAIAVYKYVCGKKHQRGWGGGSQPDQVQGVLAGITDNHQLVPGVPTFDGTPAINKPDQIAAFLPNNAMATIPQTSSSYQPAFGRNENQLTDGELHTW